MKELETKSPDVRRSLPAVSTLLADPVVEHLQTLHPKALVTHAVRTVIERARRSGRSPSDPAEWRAAVSNEVTRLRRPSLQRVINATGVVLHTNLGRAPLPAAVLKDAVELGSGWVNLEFDLEEGKRGSRSAHCVDVLRWVTGAEDALVVNNNAAAVMLALKSIAKGKEVIISRGELVEIGGGFRIPEILEASGAKLREVGTTNRTRLSDYEKAIGPETSLVLKVHPSNYRIEGFSESVPLRDLVELGRKKNLPVMFDVGSAVLRRIPGLPRAEPTAAELIQTGVDLVTFSGDKLLGGPQAGLLLGRSTWIQKMRTDPWLRIVRCDKFTLALLERMARRALSNESSSVIEWVVGRSIAELRTQAEQISAELESSTALSEVSVEATDGTLGGGSLPEEKLASVALVFRGSEAQLDSVERTLRTGEPPVVVRRREGEILFDMRTVMPEEVGPLTNACRKALEPLQR